MCLGCCYYELETRACHSEMFGRDTKLRSHSRRGGELWGALAALIRIRCPGCLASLFHCYSVFICAFSCTRIDMSWNKAVHPAVFKVQIEMLPYNGVALRASGKSNSPKFHCCIGVCVCHYTSMVAPIVPTVFWLGYPESRFSNDSVRKMGNVC